MIVAYSKNRRPKDVNARVADILRGVSLERLRGYVDMIAFPRHYEAERKANLRARDLLLRLLHGFGYNAPILQGSYDNIVVTTSDAVRGPFLLLAAHYDSVPGTPGADDNGSAVAVCLECARLLKQHGALSTMIVFFNREEDGLLGSREFVAHLEGQSAWSIDEAHIFEMVGYRDRAPHSQAMPPELPGVIAPDVGDFLALIANQHSNATADKLITLAASYIPATQVLALKIYMGLEKWVGHLHRSDHAPFWRWATGHHVDGHSRVSQPALSSCD